MSTTYWQDEFNVLTKYRPSFGLKTNLGQGTKVPTPTTPKDVNKLKSSPRRLATRKITLLLTSFIHYVKTFENSIGFPWQSEGRCHGRSC